MNLLSQVEMQTLSKKQRRRLRRERWKELPGDEKREYIADTAIDVVSFITILCGVGAVCSVIDRWTDSGFLAYIIGYVVMGGCTFFRIATSTPKRESEEMIRTIKYYKAHCDKLEEAISDAVYFHDIDKLRPVCEDEFFKESAERYYSIRCAGSSSSAKEESL